ncbi:MAG: methyltransferase domain-containing protein [Sedimentisphaerales bacterium]|nr:methyltransferase domain-containing protein [Sedimentisphaerales bacterium]
MPGARLNADLWINEYISGYDVYAHGLTRILAQKKTAFQEMCIAEAGSQGKALILDGKWQSCTRDEFLYHEPLVHPACVCHGGPQRVLVLGGGEGAAVREVLKWNTVRRAVMVDIDGEVVEACREHLPEMHQGAFEDPRTDVVIGDALDYLDHSENDWDIIISDLSDPIEEGPSFKLFTKEYYQTCRRALKADGLLVVQAGSVAPNEMHLHVRLRKTLQAVFAHTASYSSAVPTYAAPWSYILAGGRSIDERPDPAAVDRLLAEKTTGAFRMFDGRTLLGLLQPGKHLRDAIAAETRIYTQSDPPKFFGKGVSGGSPDAGA